MLYREGPGFIQFIDSSRGTESYRVKRNLRAAVPILSLAALRSLRQKISEHSDKTGLNGIAILDAHGFQKGDAWRYWDDDKNFPVQDWVNALDGKAAALYISCCNEKNATLTSQRSILVHPNDMTDPVKRFLGLGLRLYLPGQGYIR